MAFRNTRFSGDDGQSQLFTNASISYHVLGAWEYASVGESSPTSPLTRGPRRSAGWPVPKIAFGQTCLKSPPIPAHPLTAKLAVG